MRILYCTANRPIRIGGGVQRTTVTMASLLASEYDYECYSCFFNWKDGTKESCFAEEFHIGMNLTDAANAVVSFVQEHTIDVVIAQNCDLAFPACLRDAGIASGVGIVYAYHQQPGIENLCPSFSSIVYRLWSSQDESKAKLLVKALAYPAYKSYWACRAKRYTALYHSAWKASDAVIVLSNKHISEFKRVGDIDDKYNKIRAIPNALSSQVFFDLKNLGRKQKLALIVARLDERSKKISLALEAWRVAKDSGRAKDWTLRIVGYGPDEMFYHDLVFRKKIPDIEFVGQRDPIAFGDYSAAALYLMTSVSEGWGLVLTEAQQFCCVPVAFDSYLAVREIVENEKTGLLVPYPDVQAYAEAILFLMNNPSKREALACAGAESSKRFLQQNVAAQWYELFERVASTAKLPEGGGNPC